MPSNDTRSELYKKRLSCYELVLDSLSVFETKCNEPTASAEALAEADAVRSHAYDLAFASKDQIFHSTLYDWLIIRQLADDLLEVCRANFPPHSCSPNSLRYDPLSSSLICKESR